VLKEVAQLPMQIEYKGQIFFNNLILQASAQHASTQIFAKEGHCKKITK
jgi:hypothetical protein